MTNNTPLKTNTNTFVLLAGILFIALCLRGLITGVAPVMEFIKIQFHLDTVQLSLLTELPLIAFAVISPFASRLGLSVGVEKTLFLALILMILGSFIRATNSPLLLFAGTALIGIGIALANVLVPGLLKRNFANHITSVTSAYVLMMGIGATASAGVTVPIALMADSGHLPLSGWALSLICLALPSLIALIIWIPQVKSASKLPAIESSNIHKYMWKSKQAWAVSVFLGLNFVLMYIFIAWLPAMLSNSGYSEQDAGIIYGFFQFATIIPAFILPILTKWIANKKIVAIMFIKIALLGILGLVLLPTFSTLWTALIGFGTGGGLIIAMSLLSLKTSSSEQASTLSGMAQCVGYSIAALGPIFIGSLQSITGSWQVPLLCCLFIGFLWCYFAYIAVDETPIAEISNEDNAVTSLPGL
ncbi:MFS transporter [Colwellia ponticola]|uniref:CynX/NimT family MFS transporter n=1 Tax=Colwellia ponticola TaxID=2304625 RepID=A0A8H2JM48_9GAMM|nr:MFS transporter [Colwellia ponticola]TMM43988.1 CynX/NimT family MFS transporter [Colwellia ponticola]